MKAILIALGIVAVPGLFFLAAIWANDDTLSGKLALTGLMACATMAALAFLISAISEAPWW